VRSQRPQCVHGIVPGGGLAPDDKTWVACRAGFFLPVRVLSRLFRRRFLEELQRLNDGGKLKFLGEHAGLADAKANFPLHARRHAPQLRWNRDQPHATAVWQCWPTHHDRQAYARIPIAPVH
jgi:hypothetical protein